ncbi:lipase family protein [Dietzia timorensis]|uniref:Putative inactive lipase n=1 Tax=Dietzia timorensis TaxID=499555 RepID=A0A173LMW4_9ACTN|nr:lipase family protein [Dietzia timorensis]ANI92948.1 putative inactive lipase [Dietzia timorensis]
MRTPSPRNRPQTPAHDVGARPSQRRRTSRALVIVAAAGLVAATLSAPASAQEGSVSTGTGSGGGQFGGPLESIWEGTPDGRDSAFYTDPAPLENAPGRVIRTEDAQLLTTAPGDALAAAGSAGSADGAGLHANAQRVLYESTDAHGAPIAASGLFVRNEAPASARHDERPLVVLSPGTQGLGDQCAPSKTMPSVLDAQFSPGVSVGLGYEVGQVHYFLARGFSVFVTDYQGVGTPDAATYLTRDAMAHAALDGARAAKAIPESGVSDESKVGFFGHSQGGGATAAAAELAPSYAADLNIAGAAVSGPPADLYPMLDVVDRSINAGLVGFVSSGLAAAYPDAADSLRDVFNDEGQAMLDRSASSCVGDSIGAYGFADSRTWTKDGHSFADNLRSNPELDELVNAQRIGLGKPEVPVAIIQEPNDDIIPEGQVRQLEADWCAQGVQVDYLEGFLPPLMPSTATVHMAAGLHSKGADWLADRVAGGAVNDTCSAT